eukprot:11733668-Alexandrium_andersonii.AAC.1
MSASLVGSEMCIRDSLNPEPGPLRPCKFQLPIARPPQTIANAPSRTHWPVSYTHLTLPTICSV